MTNAAAKMFPKRYRATFSPPCSSAKRAWPTRSAAKKALRLLQDSGAPLRRAYHCEECGWYHLTKSMWRP